MPIITYIEQLRSLARRIDKSAEDKVMRQAFEAAGVPSSTYYRAIYGADLRTDTADKVAAALVRMDREPQADGRKAARAPAPAI